MIVLRRKLFWILALSCFGLVGAYAFFVQTSVVYRMSYESWLGKSNNLTLAIQDLESKYYGLTQSLTLQAAEGLGFVSIPTVKYLEREDSISLLDHGRDSDGR
jgi:hypothetical protein